MRQSIKLEASKPAALLSDAKLHLKIEPDVYEDDAHIQHYILAATELAERKMTRSLLYCAYRLTQAGFTEDGSVKCGCEKPPCCMGTNGEWPILLPYIPVASLIGINYYNTNDVMVTYDMNNVVLDNNNDVGPHVIYPKRGYVWPETSRRTDAVQVVYRAGYGDEVGCIPAPLRILILSLVSLYWDRDRDGQSPKAMVEFQNGINRVFDLYIGRGWP